MNITRRIVAGLVTAVLGLGVVGLASPAQAWNPDTSWGRIAGPTSTR